MHEAQPSATAHTQYHGHQPTAYNNRLKPYEATHQNDIAISKNDIAIS
jgi:hypothetical protein